MDGAKFHIRKVNPKPTTSTCIPTVHTWLKRKGVVVPLHKNGQPMSRMQLLEFVKGLQIPPIFASYEIACTNGDTIMKTPPYHCEFQSIEQVWGIIKNKIIVAPNINDTELSLKNCLLELFTAIKPR